MKFHIIYQCNFKFVHTTPAIVVLAGVLRLVDHPELPGVSLVEVYVDSWTPVCDDTWLQPEATLLGNWFGRSKDGNFLFVYE